ncbi:MULTISPECIES: chromosomal replication initiator protein DnaA [Catenuloplanes]|uniref:Uncharacterized protein n=1 Tax=Catenuloplanes niger TaxID=587534 RepID=A0AAE3ZQ78_9ACTN|nr:hypothetical protein [Catenuloplanes niger]MDR7323902.1 hypothetical protein [Catenuloplanes niger]
MNKWLTRAVGTAGLAGGFLLLTGAQAQAAPADPELLPLSGLQDGGLPLLSDLLGNAAAAPAPAGGSDTLLGGLLGGEETHGRTGFTHPAAQFLGIDSEAGPDAGPSAGRRSELGGDGGLLGALTGLSRPAESPRPGLSGLPGLTMLSALTGQDAVADRADERPVASRPGRHRAKPSPTRTRALPAQSTPRTAGAHRADDGPGHTDNGPRRADGGPGHTDNGPRRADGGPGHTDNGPRRADGGPGHAAASAPADGPRRTTTRTPADGPNRTATRTPADGPNRTAAHVPATDDDRRAVTRPGNDRRTTAAPAPAPGRRTAPAAPGRHTAPAPDPGRGGGTLAGHPADAWAGVPGSPVDDSAITVTPDQDHQGFGRAPARLAETPRQQAETPKPAESPARARPSTRAGERPVAGLDPDYS